MYLHNFILEIFVIRNIKLKLSILRSWFYSITGIVIENVIFTILSERKLGPKLLGVFAGGRIEEYIPVSNNGASILEFSYWAYSIFIVILNDIMRTLVIAFYTRSFICIFSNWKLYNLNHKIRVLGTNPIVSIFRLRLPKMFEKILQLNLSDFVGPSFHFLLWCRNRLIFVFSFFSVQVVNN